MRPRKRASLFFSSLARRSGPVIAITIFLFGLSAAVGAQTCPAYLAPDIPLSNPATATISCTTSQGRTVCSLWCTYTKLRGETLDTADIKVQWVSEKLRADAPVLDDSCGADQMIVNGRRHADKQALVRWAASNSNLQNYAAIEASHLLNKVGSLSVFCRGTRPEQPPPPEPGCSGSLPQGKVRSPVGLVEIYSHAFNKWKGPITSEFPVFACDFVRTGPNSSATVFIFTPSGAEDRVNVGADTILEIPARPAERPAGEPGYLDLIKGTIQWWTDPGLDPRRPPSPFNVRTPTIVTARRGTEFVIHHDALKKQDFVFLHSGKLEVSAGGRKLVLEPGQQIFTENTQLSPVYEMSAATWTAIVEKKPIQWTNVFANAKRIEIGKTDGGKDGPTKGIGEGSIGGFTGPIYNIAFRGRGYRTVYESSLHEGVPIDVYFYEILGPDSLPVSQDGAKLWGRFVRHPAVGHEGKGDVTYYFVEWIFRGGRWEISQGKSEAFQPVREVQK